MSSATNLFWTSPEMRARVAGRYRAERIFRGLGLFALLVSVAFLVLLLGKMLYEGWSGFVQTQVQIEATLDAETLQLDDDRSLNALRSADFQSVLLRDSAMALGDDGAEIVSENAWVALRDKVVEDPTLIGRKITIWVPTTSKIDLLNKGKLDDPLPGADGEEAIESIDPAQAAAFERLKAAGKIRTSFNSIFVSTADSTSPETAGIWGAFIGSLLTLAATLGLSFPGGVMAAIYLEEYAPKNRVTELIEVSINNLAAVPSIIFGLLGLAVFLNTFNMPRSAPIVGGLTLALMTLPVIVIAARNALKAVPPSIKDAALGVGASKMQMIFDHLFPLALPGILTGSIIGMARALGETAPLLMIGMRAFIVDAPRGFTEPATVLPVQIFLWTDDVNRGFVEKTSAAIIVLLIFLLLMNGIAIYLRNKFERRW